MSNEQKTSARNGFFLGIGTAAIIGALAIVAVRFDGTAKATIVRRRSRSLPLPQVCPSPITSPR